VALLDVKDLRTSFRTEDGVVRAVEGVNFTVEKGQTLGIVGESGCGKSVTCLTIMGLNPKRNTVVGGEALWKGNDLLTMKPSDLRAVRGDEISMIFQDPMTSLNPTLTIGTQITETIRRHLGLSKAEADKRAIQLLEEVHIPDAARRMRDYPHRFSGGMRQRVMIAMALSCSPKLLIADEPTTALDVTVQAGVLETLDELRRDHGMTMIIISHNMGVIAETAEQVLVMYAGQIVEQASVTDLFDRPEHPYTEALLGSLPKIDDHDPRNDRLATIPGRPPDLLTPPDGCRFAARCKYAGMDSCAAEPPQLREIRTGHWVRSQHPASERSAEPVGAR